MLSLCKATFSYYISLFSVCFIRHNNAHVPVLGKPYRKNEMLVQNWEYTCAWYRLGILFKKIVISQWPLNNYNDRKFMNTETVSVVETCRAYHGFLSLWATFPYSLMYWFINSCCIEIRPIPKTSSSPCCWYKNQARPRCDKHAADSLSKMFWVMDYIVQIMLWVFQTVLYACVEIIGIWNQ